MKNFAIEGYERYGRRLATPVSRDQLKIAHDVGAPERARQHKTMFHRTLDGFMGETEESFAISLGHL